VTAALVPAPRLVLADRLISRSLATAVALVSGGVALTALLAQVAVPLWPVPITGQTLAVLLVGSTLGAARGAISMTLYAVLGVLGLPIFTDASHGLAVLLGGTGGFILGFIVSAAFVGWLSERQWDRRWFKAAATFLAGTVVTFLIGLPWLYAVLSLAGPAVWQDAMGAETVLAATIAGGLTPFILGGVIKAAIAAVLLPAAWWGAERITRDRTAS
jgi:biotin transport system substrate-specific component